MAHTYAHLPSDSSSRHLLEAAVTVLVIIAAVLIATRWDVGGGTDTTQRAPALEHPGNVDPWQAYFAGLTSERGAPDTASACRAGAGLDCLLAQVR